jgi:hypothetical protein
VTTVEYDTGAKTQTVGLQAHWPLLAIVLAALAVYAGWMAYLALTLPATYEAQHWGWAWIGLDIAEVVCTATTVCLAWFRRPFTTWAHVGATLLVCDAWFDVTTASSADLGFSIALAAVVELPAAIFLVLWDRKSRLRAAGDRTPPRR